VIAKAPFIAVVDDDEPVRKMLDRVLGMAHYRVLEFASGEDFLSSLTRHLPICAILDVHMPGLTGLAVQSQLRAAHLHIPVVFITASDDLGLDDSAREAGGIRLLRKPFTSEELLNAVGDAVGGAHAGT
jgi:FixJ family two-component response regulator